MAENDHETHAGEQEEESIVSTTKFQVVIVGGGPVGMGLAVDLGLRGITVKVIERYTEIQNIPKGQNLMQRTLEHFYFWGIADELRAARVMPNNYPIGGVTAYHDMMNEYWVAPPGREQVRKFFFQDNDRLPQYQMEKVLRARAAQLPNVELLLGWQAEKIEQDANGVRVTIAERNGSGKEVIEAEYVVGCDGARSVVRDQVGIDKGGRDHDQAMVLAVFRSTELHEGFKRFPERTTYRAMHPDAKGYWQFFGRIDVGEGWFFHAPVPKDTTRDNFDFHGLIQKVAGFKFKAEFDYVGFWDMRIAIAEQYQVGRVFIAGDAAHSHPPYGGFGVNNGLEDARNLGWKIAATLQGWGSDKLLASYSDERRAIFKETGEDFIGKVIENERKFLETYDPKKDKAAFEEAWNNHEENMGGRIGRYEPNFEGSAVIWGPEGGKNTAHGRHMVKARAGHHLTPRPLSTGKDVYEELGTGFTLIALDSDDATQSAFESAAKALKVPFKVIRDSYAGSREEYESKLILVRPDQYVVWTGNEKPADAQAVLAKAIGR